MRGIIGRKEYLDYLITTYGDQALLFDVIEKETELAGDERKSVEDEAGELARITAKIKQATKAQP